MPPSLQSLARLGVVRLGRRLDLATPPHILKYNSLWWSGAGPISFVDDGVLIGNKHFSLDDAFIHAARGGHLGLAELRMEVCAGHANWAAPHKSVVETFRGKYGVHIFNEAMVCAAEGGHESIVRLCRDGGASDVGWAMAMAAGRGHEAIVRLCREWGSSNVDWAMVEAAEGGPWIDRAVVPHVGRFRR